MIVCHCNFIDHSEIERATADLRADDALAFLTPVMVYKALGKRPRCGGCLSLASSIMYSATGPNCATCPFAAGGLAGNLTEAAPVLEAAE